MDTALVKAKDDQNSQETILSRFNGLHWQRQHWLKPSTQRLYSTLWWLSRRACVCITLKSFHSIKWLPKGKFLARVIYSLPIGLRNEIKWTLVIQHAHAPNHETLFGLDPAQATIDLEKCWSNWPIESTHHFILRNIFVKLFNNKCQRKTKDCAGLRPLQQLCHHLWSSPAFMTSSLYYVQVEPFYIPQIKGHCKWVFRLHKGKKSTCIAIWWLSVLVCYVAFIICSALARLVCFYAFFLVCILNPFVVQRSWSPTSITRTLAKVRKQLFLYWR